MSILVKIDREEKELEKELKSYREFFASISGSISDDNTLDGGEDAAMTVLDKSKLELQELCRLFRVRRDTWQQDMKRHSIDPRKSTLAFLRDSVETFELDVRSSKR